MDSGGHQLVPAESQLKKTSVKRCLSPAEMPNENSVQAKNRKVTNPMLMLVQAKIDDKNVTLSDLDQQYRLMVDKDKNIQTNNTLSRQDSDPTPTYDQVSTEILQSADSLSVGSLPSFTDCSRSSSRLTCSVKRSSFSSSYTSWTKPLAGQKISDSCVPNSSILDVEPELPDMQRLPSDKLARRSRRSFKRNSSDDTSKDISDIEDFDLDDIDEDKEDLEKQAKDKDKQLEKDKFENMNFSFHHKSITS